MPKRTILLAAVAAALALGPWTAAEAAKPKTKAVPYATVKAFPGKLALSLPPVIYATPGIETNVYFGNVCLAADPADYVFDVSFVEARRKRRDRTYGRGLNQTERFTFTPKVNDAKLRERGFMIRVLDDTNQAVACAKSTIRVADAGAGAGLPVTVVFLGDGHTDGAPLAKALAEVCKAPQSPNLTTKTVRLPSGSPAKAAQACRGLGAGQVFAVILGGAAGRVEPIVAAVRKANPTAKIGVLLPVPPSAAPEARAANRQAKAKLAQAAEALAKRFAGREKEGVFVVPVNVGLDCVHCYAPTKGAAAHPDAAGYLQMADMIYAWMKNELPRPAVKEEK